MMTTAALTRRQEVRQHIERTRKPGQLFRVEHLADELGWWNEQGCANVEFSVRELVDDGVLWRFVDVEAQRTRARPWVRFALAVPPPARD